MAKKSNSINVSGKRKTAIARATIKEGKGKVKINKVFADTITPEISKLKIAEPLMIAGDLANKVDIDVSVQGGGYNSQAEAVRLAISRALIKYSKDEQLEKDLLNYDRTLLVADVRRRESRKPNNHGKARSKVQFSKR